MTDEMFLKEIIKTNGNCNGLDCVKCPIKKKCNTNETKQTTMIRARYFLTEKETRK